MPSEIADGDEVRCRHCGQWHPVVALPGGDEAARWIRHETAITSIGRVGESYSPIYVRRRRHE